MNIKPHASIAHIFESYRILKTEGVSSALTIFPDAAGCMVVFMVDDIVQRITLWGPMSIARHISGTCGQKGSKIILLEFWPLGSKRFFGVIDCQLKDQVVDLKAAYPSVYIQLYEHLNRWGLAGIDNLLAKISHYGEIKSQAIFSELMGKADQSYYSRRHKSRLLIDDLGISAKQLQRINRFYCALKLIKTKRPLDEIAYQTGYYDSSHLIKDFTTITKVKPSAYQKNMSDFYSEGNKLL